MSVFMPKQVSAELLSQLLTHHLAIDPAAVSISAIEAGGAGEFFLAQSLVTVIRFTFQVNFLNIELSILSIIFDTSMLFT